MQNLEVVDMKVLRLIMRVSQRDHRENIIKTFEFGCEFGCWETPKKYG